MSPTRQYGVSTGVVFVLALVLGSTGCDARSGVARGLYTAEQADRGEDVYAAMCSTCHGVDLSGGGITPPLAGGSVPQPAIA